jgi:hypothetical protein
MTRLVVGGLSCAFASDDPRQQYQDNEKREQEGEQIEEQARHN